MNSIGGYTASLADFAHFTKHSGDAGSEIRTPRGPWAPVSITGLENIATNLGDNMAKETIGLLMIQPDPIAVMNGEEAIIATAFLPAEQLPNGKVRVLNREQGKKMWELGLRPMVAVKSEVTRHGTAITYCGYELYFLESVPAAWREVIKQHSPKLVETMLEEYSEKLNARSGKT